MELNNHPGLWVQNTLPWQAKQLYLGQTDPWLRIEGNRSFIDSQPSGAKFVAGSEFCGKMRESTSA